MSSWIKDYVKGCATCQQNKIATHTTKVPLYRIPTSPTTNPFQQIAMDLITQLPNSRGYNAILTIVDHGCSRAALFLPCQTTIGAPGIAALYFRHVYQWFGLPTKIISDRDPRFTSQFAKALAQRIPIDWNLSTAFHPRTDGLSERMNQWVEQYLRLVAHHHPGDWSDWLPLATLMHNTRRHSLLKITPAQALLGYNP
jgi:transposase InsO family protein